MATKKELYIERVGPLIEQIIGICKENRIPMLATFSVDAEMCTSALLNCEWDTPSCMHAALRMIYPDA